MRVWISRAVAIALAMMAALMSAPLAAQAQTADTVLVKGNVVTVDDRFTVAQALATFVTAPAAATAYKKRGMEPG